ncbi:MAG TPA: tRNA 2-selenouridine(34) synthase MnmH [Waterburya sp.]|jgi:tRNA 2-selenouridine synthase
MPRSPKYTLQPWTQLYSEIIDVRSESEFAEDHMPDAINLPVLNNAERAKVGTLYKQVSPFEARKVGASLIAQNIARHLDHHFISKDKHYHPLIYCWRGGQRSNSMASVLSQIGWQVTVLEGGYKTYRTYVRTQSERLPKQFTYWVLCGLTGSGKTHILRQLAQRGVQVLDLENLAHHRGSLLGQEWEGQPSPQPSQKRFESLLIDKLCSFDASKPVWVEAESNKIGEIYLPPSLWEQMKQAKCVEVQVPKAARIEWLLQEYPHFTTHPDLVKRLLQHLKSRYGREQINQWYSLIDAGQWHALVEDLVTCHYDPTYSRSMGRSYVDVERTLQLADLSDDSIHTFLDTLELLT